MFSFVFSPFLRADAPLHAQVLVFLPAYEGSKLYDPNLVQKEEDAPCVWGGLVARTFLSENPQWAERIAKMILVGAPNLGSVKAIKTLIVGPGGLKENATSFPASLLNLLPSNVDANLTKLVAISRPSLYELLPFDDPHWECVAADGSRSRVSAQEMLSVGPWQTYWPTPELERRTYLDGWLKKRMADGRKKIDLPDWEFCQDPDLRPLQKILAQVRDWRLRMGSLSYTNTLLTRPG